MPILAWQISKEIVDATEQTKEPRTDPKGAGGQSGAASAYQTQEKAFQQGWKHDHKTGQIVTPSGQQVSYTDLNAKGVDAFKKR